MFKQYVMKHKIRFTTSIILNFLWSIPVVLIPYIMGLVIDELDTSPTIEAFLSSSILQMLMALLGLLILQYGFMATSQYLSAGAIADTTREIRSDMFNSLQKQSHKYFDEENTGDLVSKTTSDIVSVVNFYRMVTLEVGLMVGKIIFITTILLIIDIQLGIIGIIALPLMILVVRYFDKRYTPLTLKSRELYGKMAGEINENIDNIAVTKVFYLQQSNITNLRSTMEELRDLNLRRQRMSAVLDTQSPLLTGLVVIAFLFVGGLKVLNGQLTIGGLITALLLARYLQDPVGAIGTIGVFYGNYKASKSRIVRVLLSNPDIKSPETPIVPTSDTFTPKIEFVNVDFGYSDESVLNNINLKIPAKATVSILGASGSGKSALINLIPRFYDPDDGVILIGDKDIRLYDILELRRQIGFVDQETFLFSRSIRDNISFGNPEAGLEQIISVSKTAQIDDFIQSLEDGYDTVIGERGITLSGGQRQRLSIARALLTDPEIVIFDDSLSAVDLKTEHLIQQALNALIVDRTVIFVTQRLSTVKSSDLNIILHRGEIIEQGSHEGLLQRDGVYSRLYETQVDDVLDLSFIETPVVKEGDN